MKISENHHNRKLHNWLVYNIGENFLLKNAPLYKGVMYDLGCGEATYKKFFLNYVDQYVGVDWAGSFHDTKADVAADLNKPVPIDSEVADTIVSLSVMEHLCEPQNMLNEACRILKPGGNIVLQVPWQWWIHEAPYDFYRYTPYGLEFMFEKAGFINVVVEPQSGFFTTWVMKFNYFSRRFVRGPKPLKALAFTVLVPFWTLGQLTAPWLDKLDRNWSLESSGYFVTAKKPNAV
ncbi:methyltransferase domain-containing protein [Alphaproteobacteria bacterium LSUCC0684]